ERELSVVAKQELGRRPWPDLDARVAVAQFRAEDARDDDQRRSVGQFRAGTVETSEVGSHRLAARNQRRATNAKEQIGQRVPPHFHCGIVALAARVTLGRAKRGLGLSLMYARIRVLRSALNPGYRISAA